MAKISKKDELYTLLQPQVEALGYRCVDVEYGKIGKDWTLTLYIDKDEGIGLDDCETVSRPISDFLDDTDPIEHSYIFEVSSPGLDRPFKRLSDYEAAVGAEIDISLYQAFNGSKLLTGCLQNADEQGIEIMTADEQSISIQYSEIAKTTYHIEF